MSSKVYQCQFCEENIDRNHKEDHYALCDKFESFVSDHICQFCDKIFDDNIALRKHIKRIHTAEPKDSNDENVTLKSFEEAKVEILGKLKNFKSEDDQMKFLDWIRDEALEELKSQCPILDDLDLQDVELVDSRSDDSGEVNQSLNNIEAFSLLKKDDITLAMNQKNYKCNSCGKSFKKENYSKKHIHTVHKCHKDFKCNSCGKSFSWAGPLKEHIHTIHEDHKVFIQIEDDVEMSKNEDFEVSHKSTQRSV